MTPSASPTQVPKPKKRKKKPRLTIAWATVIAAVIAGGFGFAGGYFSQHNTAAATPAPSTSTTPLGPASLTITQPLTGDIHWKDNYSGQAINLQPGQLVWTFNQTVTGGNISDKVYPDTGPCMVDYTHQQWACTGVYVGSESDNKTYMVCAAIIDSKTAFAIVDDLRSEKKDFSIPLSSLPSINDKPPSCMSVHRI
jgi:hypothetical protein